MGACLVVVQGSEGDVSPGWYPSKRADVRVVPTWNYAIVQARGRPRVIEDAAWLRRQIVDLTALHEAPRAEPWAVSDAPEPFATAQVRALIGVEIPITHLEGQWKMSQNRSEADRTRVIAGLQAPGENVLAGLVAERSRS